MYALSGVYTVAYMNNIMACSLYIPNPACIADAILFDTSQGLEKFSP